MIAAFINGTASKFASVFDFKCEFQMIFVIYHPMKYLKWLGVVFFLSVGCERLRYCFECSLPIVAPDPSVAAPRCCSVASAFCWALLWAAFCARS